MTNNKIDFVITWVDSNDLKWRKKKNEILYGPNFKDTDSSDERYREWDFLKYWFRAVEKNANWFNKIYFVTEGHLPEWLNINNPRLVIVKHDEFIPKSDLPTFNSCAIEVNFNKIKDLSDKFVYFNDDMFLNDLVVPTDFFVNDIPVDSCLFSPIRAINKVSTNIEFNCMNIINDNFSFKKFRKENLFKIINLQMGIRVFKNMTLSIYNFFTGFSVSHLPTPFLKDTFDDVWEKCDDKLREVSSHKFRENSDLSQWLFQYWQFASGKFHQRNWNFGKYYNVNSDFEKILNDISNSKHKMICINDENNLVDFEKKRDRLIKVFENKYFEKSSFEK